MGAPNGFGPACKKGTVTGLNRKTALTSMLSLSILLAPFTITHAMPAHIYVKGVQAISQNPELPTGCEMACLTMLLRWGGHNVSMTQLAKQFPKESVPYQEQGVWLGGNPHQGFVGNPFSHEGYGTFHDAAYTFLRHVDTRAADLSGQNFDTMLNTVEQGHPVVAWVTINLNEPRQSLSWRTHNGGMVDWKTPEHAVLIVGFSTTDLYAIDPLTGKEVAYPRALFQERWQQMGAQAVTLR